MNPSGWPAPSPGTRWLIRLPNWIGDAVMVLPALRALPRDGQVWMGVAHPRVAPLYEAAGLFDELLPARGASAPLRLRAAVRAFAPQRAVVLTEAVSGGLLARFSGAPLRLGRAGAGRGTLFTHPWPPGDRSRPLWEEYLELVSTAGGVSPGNGSLDFVLEPGEAARGRVSELLGESPDPMPVALAPGAAFGPAKQWPLESFRQLTLRLVAGGSKVVVLGGDGEREAGGFLADAGARDLTGRTTVLEAVAVLGRCRALITNDSGALHLGRAAGAPVVGLFGSSSPRWTGPTPAEGEALTLGLDCSPCFKRRCPLAAEAHLRCLKDLTVERVLEALKRVVPS